MRQSLLEYCTGSRFRPLLDEWDAARNLPLTPQSVTHGSHAQVWWRCAQGHSWRAAVFTRTGGAGCPYCAGRRVQPGFNDLATLYPALAEQWDREKNAPLDPSRVSAGSPKAAWWRCEKGHSWRAVVKSRVSGCGCPVCAGRQLLPGENDLATLFPELADQWDPERNGPLTPRQVTPTSNRKVWWLCPRGHSFQAVIAARTNGSDCPYCANRKVLKGFNDLATLHPRVAAEWHPTLNGALTPEQVTPGSRKKVWWRCAFGHVWKAAIYSRTGPKKCGCPVCAGTRQRPRPPIACPHPQETK